MTSVGGNNYTYDSNGNLLTGGGRTLTWDVKNRVKTVTEDAVTTRYVYDGDGSRVKKIVGGTTTIYVNQYYEKNLTTGIATTSYFLGGNIDVAQVRAQREDTTLKYILQDHLGGTLTIWSQLPCLFL